MTSGKHKKSSTLTLSREIKLVLVIALFVSIAGIFLGNLSLFRNIFFLDTVKTSIPETVKNTRIVYFQNKIDPNTGMSSTNIIIQKDLLDNMDVVKIPVGKYPTFAINSDRDLLAYFSDSATKDLYIYDLKSHSMQEIIAVDHRINSGAIVWSPNNTYIEYDDGTATIGSCNIYDVISGEMVTTQRCYREPFWKNDNELVFSDITDDFHDRPYETGSSEGIFKYDIAQKKRIQLLAPTKSTDFQVKNVIDNEIYYSASNVGNNSSTYWKFNVDGNKISLSEKEFEIANQRINLDKEIEAKVTDVKDFVSWTSSRHWNEPSWVLFVQNTSDNNAPEGGSIYITNLQDPKHSLLKIADGVDAVW